MVFWFVLLGPTGAWLFRVLDLMQRRAVLHANQNETVNEQDEITQVVHAILFLHRMFAWLPARLLAVGFMLAGSYEGALSAWKNLRTTDSLLFPGPNDQLLGAIGAGAAQTGTAASVTDKAMAARDLVGRTLWMIWCPVLAVLTLYDLML